jgi:hypothetical protein
LHEGCRLELIGNFKNGGTDYRPKGDPLDVNLKDFNHGHRPHWRAENGCGKH